MYFLYEDLNIVCETKEEPSTAMLRPVCSLDSDLQ